MIQHAFERHPAQVFRIAKRVPVCFSLFAQNDAAALRTKRRLVVVRAAASGTGIGLSQCTLADAAVQPARGNHIRGEHSFQASFIVPDDLSAIQDLTVTAVGEALDLIFQFAFLIYLFIYLPKVCGLPPKRKDFCRRGMTAAWGGPVIMALVWVCLKAAGVVETLTVEQAVLYIDYMGIYLLNGWLPAERIGMFTLIFIAAFAVIWLIIYGTIRMKVNRINQKMQA